MNLIFTKFLIWLNILHKHSNNFPAALFEGLRSNRPPGATTKTKALRYRGRPGIRSGHAGEGTIIHSANAAFTSVPSKQKSTQKGSLLKSTQKTLLGTLVFVSFVLFLLRLFCNNLFYNTIELVILFPTKIVLHPTQTDTLLPLLHDLSITYYKYTNIISNIFFCKYRRVTIILCIFCYLFVA